MSAVTRRVWLGPRLHSWPTVLSRHSSRASAIARTSRRRRTCRSTPTSSRARPATSPHTVCAAGRLRCRRSVAARSTLSTPVRDRPLPHRWAPLPPERRTLFAVFPHFCGIFIASTAFMLIYAGACQRMVRGPLRLASQSSSVTLDSPLVAGGPTGGGGGARTRATRRDAAFAPLDLSSAFPTRTGRRLQEERTRTVPVHRAAGFPQRNGACAIGTRGRSTADER